MKLLASKWIPLAVAIAACNLVAPQPLRAEVIPVKMKVAEMTVRYRVVVPDGYDPSKAYPGVLAFAGGEQTINAVERILRRNFRKEAEKRGYIVVAPAAPRGRLFFQSGARVVPELLKAVLASYKIQDGKFHIAGPSNGGISALHVAAEYPEHFLSVTAFPGYMWESSEEKLRAISNLCVFMYVGEFDRYLWHGEMNREAEFLRSEGTRVRYTVERGERHSLNTLAGVNAGRLFDGFGEAEGGCLQ